jgi:diguanylate cyclase (GGDEF)-like protein/PAS domain S-box-containing protein
MTAAAPRIPGSIRWTVVLGLLGLAVTVPFSAPDGTGMQWDEVVLAPAAAYSGWALLRVLRTMTPSAARPWRFVVVGAVLFMLGQLASCLFPGPAFDDFGVDDVVLVAGAVSPLLTCGLLARRVIRTRWTTLILDGVRTAVALFVVADILLAHHVHPGAGGEAHALVLLYGGYAAVILGSAGALCTVSTAALRRSASTMIWANVFMASAAISESMALVAPSPVWTMAADTAVLLGLQAVVLAATRAPKRFERSDVRASAPRVGAGGIVITLVAMLGLPVVLAYAVLRGEDLHADALLGCAVVLALSALRVVLRIREDGRVTEDLVRQEEDFRGLVESSSDGVAIVDGEATLLFASPAARALLGIDGPLRDDVVLPDLVDPEDRLQVRAGLADGGVPVLHFRVVAADGTRHEIEATTTVRPGGQERRVLYLRDVTVRRRRERELERMAYTDHLTALPNRAQLFREMALDEGGPGERCLLVLDLDGFKTVNDVAGHEAGDQLLVEVARRLHTVVREGDLVTRLGGDEFAILVEGSVEESVEVAQRIVHVLALSHRAGPHTFAVGGSVGVARLGAGGGQVAFREADAALRAAKQAGKGCVRVAGDAPVTADADVAAALVDGSLRLRLDSACDAAGRVVMVHVVPVWEHPGHDAVVGQEV